MSLQNYSGKSKNPFDDDDDEMASGKFFTYLHFLSAILVKYLRIYCIKSFQITTNVLQVS